MKNYMFRIIVFLKLLPFIIIPVLGNASNSSHYPIKIINRPSTMTPGILETNLSTGISGDGSLSTAINAALGLASNLEAQFEYGGIAFNKFELSDRFGLGIKYKYLSIPHVSFSLEGRLPLYVDEYVFKDFTISLPTVFYNDFMAGGILGNLFTITVNPNIEFQLDLPFWVGFQANENLWISASSSFGRINLENKNKQAEFVSHMFWNRLPLGLEATYAVNEHFDVGVSLKANDLLTNTNFKDTLYAGVNLTFRSSDLF